MATNRQIKGKVVLEVETEGESEALAKLRARFAAVTAKVGVEAGFRRSQLQANLTAEAGKGRGLRVDVAGVFSRPQLQRALKVATAKPLVANVDAKFNRAQIQRALREVVNAKPPKITVQVDAKRGAFKAVVSTAEGIQREITDLEKRHLEQRETDRARAEQRENAIRSKGVQDRLTTAERALRSIEASEQRHFARLVEFDAAAASRREVIDAQLQSRLEAQDNAFRQRRILAAEREQIRLQRLASRPIIQRILVNTDAINASLADFDRTVSRGLRTSLLAFTTWSAGVTAAVGIAATAGVVAFANLETAAVNAGTVIATQTRIDELDKFGKAVSDFATVTEGAQKRIEEVSQRVALQTRFDPTEIANGIGALLKAGQTAQEAFTNIGSAAEFASVNAADLGETAEGLAKSLASAGLDADQSALLLDKISVTAAKAVGDVEDYFQAFSNGAAAAGRIIGATTDETLLVLRLLGQAGTLGLEAGTQVDIIFRDLGRAAVRSADEWRKYGLTANGTVTDQLVLLAELIERTGTNRIEQAKLRKELGLQEKSFRSISRIIPQIQNLGADTPARLQQIQREIATTARSAEGTVGLQLAEQRKTISFQFDQLLDSFKIAFQEFGEGTGDEIAGLFDQFAGAGGLLERSLPQVREFGEAFGRIVQQVTDFVQTDSFLNGVETLSEAVQVTLSGFGDAFTEFSAAFNDGQKSASTFEAIADSILAFSRVAATVLPAVARILGQIFDFLIDNADAFEFFAKLTVGVFLVRRAYTLLVKPAGEALLAIDKVTKAVALAAATGSGGLVVNALAGVATRFGLISASADAATASVTALTAAQVANARAANAGILAAGAADATRATRTATSGRGLLALDAGVAATEIFSERSRQGSAATQTKAATGFTRALNAMNPIADKTSGRFAKLAAIFGKLVPEFVKASPALVRIGGAFAKFAGPIGLVILAIEAGIGAVRGFVDELRRGGDSGSDFAASLAELKPVFDAVIETGKFLLDILAVVGRVGASIGRLLARAFKGAIDILGDFVRGFKLLFEGDIIGSLKAFGDALFNAFTTPFRLAISFVIDLIGDVVGSLKRLDKLLPGSPIRDLEEALRGGSEAVADFKLNMSEAAPEAEKTAAATKKVGTEVDVARKKLKDAEAQLKKNREALEAVGNVPGVDTSAAVANLKAAEDAAASARAELKAATTEQKQQFALVTQITDLNAQATARVAAQTAAYEQSIRGLSEAQIAMREDGFLAASAIENTARATENARAVFAQALPAGTAGFDALASSADNAGTSVQEVGFLAASAAENQRVAAQQAIASVNQWGSSLVNTGVDALRSSESVQRWAESFEQTERSAVSLLDVTNTFQPNFSSLAASAEADLNRINVAAQSTTTQLQFMLAALQAGAGIDPSAALNAGLEGATLENPNVPESIKAPLRQRLEDDAAVKRAREAIRRNQRVNARLVAEGVIDDTPEPLTSSGTGSGGSTGRRASFVDPDDAIKAAVDRLKPAQRIAETQAAIAKATAATDASSARTKNALDGVAQGYQASRREVALFEAALPALNKQIEAQRTEVEALDKALGDLQNTQLEGSKAFSDQAFELEQQQKALQLQKLDLEIAGTAEGDPALVAIEEQLKSLQQQSERVSLVEALELDPLRRQLEATFNPTTEASFANIISQFKQLTAERAASQANLERTERTQQIISEAAEAGAARFDKLDEASRRAFERIQESSARASSAIGSVGTSSAAASRQVNRYSEAVENVPSGRGVVDKSLKVINDRVTELASQFQGAGTRVVVLFAQGINRAAASTLYPALATVVGETLTYFRSVIPPAESIGERVMDSFLKGLKAGFGTPKEEGSVAWYLNVFIPQWIKDNKGPVAYDATILVPAGHAIMDGFGRGLRDGFGQVQDFVKDVGPSLKEFITGDEFSARTATIMADIAVGKTPDIEAALGDLRLEATPGAFPGFADPALSFLHPTMSLADTIQQAFGIVKALGGGLNTGGSGQISRPDGTRTSSGNISAHTEGTAADIGTGTSMPTAASLRLFAQAQKLLGRVFRQVIHNGIGLNAGGGSFADSQHFDHVHLEWIKALGFSENSGKIGKPLVTDIPGASNRIDAAISTASARHGVELALLAAVAKQESRFNPKAVSPAGAGGLFQFMPATARGFGIDPFNIEQAADGGARFLKNLLAKFGGRYDLALAGYNAGPNAPGLSEGKLPPYAETRNYVRLVTSYLEEFRKQFGGFREHGGPVRHNQSYVVGERGPELFTPTSTGTIVNAKDTARIMGQGAAPSTVYHDNRQITVETAATDPEAVAALVEMRTRTRLTGVNVR